MCHFNLGYWEFSPYILHKNNLGLTAESRVDFECHVNLPSHAFLLCASVCLWMTHLVSLRRMGQSRGFIVWPKCSSGIHLKKILFPGFYGKGFRCRCCFDLVFGWFSVPTYVSFFCSYPLTNATAPRRAWPPHGLMTVWWAEHLSCSRVDPLLSIRPRQNS